MRKIYSLFIATILLSVSVSVKAQFAVTTNGGSGLAATYPSLAAAVTALNGATITGPVIITCPTGTETAPVGGYSITASGTSTNTITIQGNGAANSIITAFTPQASGGRLDAVIKIVGGDYITIQNFTLQENAGNTVNTLASNTKTEFGVALFYTTATNGAQNNTIQNNTISLSQAYQNSIGIYSNTTHTATVPGTAANASSNAGMNSGLKIYGNTIQNVANGISVITPANTATLFDSGLDIGGTASGTGNIITSFGNATAPDAAWNGFLAATAGIHYRSGINANIQYNQITGSALSATSYGIIFSAITNPAAAVVYSQTASNNTINLTQNSTNGAVGILFNYGTTNMTINASSNNISLTQTANAASAGGITGISAGNGRFTASNISSNTIILTQGTSAGALTGQMNGIVNYPSTANSGTQTINSNIITFKQNAPTGTGSYGAEQLVYIYSNTSGIAFNLTTGIISNNQFLTTGSTLRTTGAVFGILHDYTFSTGLTMNANTFNLDRTGAGVTYGTYSTINGSTAALSLTNNSFTMTGSIASGAVNVFDEEDGVGSVSTQKTVTGNTIGINTPSQASLITGFTTNYSYGSYSTNTHAITTAGSYNGTSFGTNSGAFTINNNSFSIGSSGTSPTITPINATAGGAFTITNNTITGISASAAGASAPTITAITSGTAAANTISGNSIANITTGAGSGTATITAISVSAGTTTNVFKNKISDVGTANTGASSLVSGLKISAGTTNNVYNNLIGNLTSSGVSSTDAIRGINITSTTASTTHNIYYNTLYLAASSSGTNFGTSGIYHTISTTATTSALNLRNNIIVNNSTPAGTGTTIAYRRSGGAASNLANYSSTSNNNLFYAGTPGATRLIYSDGTSSAQTINAYKTGVFTAGTVSPRDGLSVSENPSFLSTIGSNSNFLHIDPAVATQIESAAVNISGYTDDYDADIRQGNAGYTGTGTAPDMGADEFAGTPADLTAPVITYTALPGTCSTSDVTLSGVVITDATGVPTSGTLVPRIYYRKGAGTWFSQAGTLLSGTATNGTWSFTIVVSDMGGVAIGDVISYYVIAQDVTATSNIGSNPAAGLVATDVNTVTTHPTSPNSYTIQNTLSGTYTVGTGQTYANLTAAAAAYNTSCIGGPIVFSIVTNTAEPGAVVFNANIYQNSTNTVTIKPASVGLTISGNAATALVFLNGADYFTIDGSAGSTLNTICPLSAASRDLTFSNTNTGGSEAVIWLGSNSTDGATNNTVKNCIINGSGTITAFIALGSGGSVVGNAATAQNNNNSFINNAVTGALYGVNAFGTSAASKDQGTVINQNTISTVLIGGIFTAYQNSITISGNSINNVIISATYFNDVYGISLGVQTIAHNAFTGNEVTNATVTKNVIGVIQQTNTSSASGIVVAPATSGTNLVADNMISGVLSNGTASKFGSGIYVHGGSGSTTNIYFNSVSMTGTTTGSNRPSIGIAVGGASTNPVVNIKNNIVSVTGSTGANKNYAIGSTSGTITNLASNYNDLYVSGTNSAIGETGALNGGTTYGTLALWQSGTTEDLNSQNVLPVFVSATDLHLNNSNISNALFINAKATTGTGVGDDIDCDVRDALLPDIGADEVIFPTPPSINLLTLNTPAACSAVAHNVTANITSGTTPILSVILNYSFNGVAQAPITMTGGTILGTSDWTATIPAATPTNALVTWTVTVNDILYTVGPTSGLTYQDDALSGVTITAGASAASVCAGNPFNLTATVTGLATNTILTEGFENSFPPTGWTLINAGSGNQWIKASYGTNFVTPHSGTYSMAYIYNATNAANAWAITPARTLTAGNTYTVSFWYLVDPSYPEKLKVTVGTGNTVALQTTVLYNNASLTNGTYAQASFTYTPLSSGSYYFGFNCYSIADEDFLAIDDVQITESTGLTYSWTSVPAGFTSSVQNPTGVTQTVPTTYYVTASTGASCSVTSSPGVTVGISAPLSGTYSVGSGSIGGEAGHYATLTAAVNAYNSVCVTGPIVFALTDANYTAGTGETFPIIINANGSASSTNTLTIKPNTGVSATITGSAADAIIKLNAADYVTIDGSNSGGTDKSLVINNSNSAGLSVVWIASTATKGSTFNTIKNCIVTGFSGSTTAGSVLVSGSSAGNPAEVANSNTTITNNTFNNAQNGVFAIGNATTPDVNWVISNNTMGSSVAAEKGYRGIAVQNVNGYTISGNTIVGVSTSSISVASGILAGGLATNGTISNNIIRDIKNTNATGYGSNGLYLNSSSTAANTIVYNNMISDVASVGYALNSVDDNGYGIIITAGAGYTLNYNTVSMNTNQSATGGLPAALNVYSGVTATNGVNLRNNIFSNTQTVGTERYAIYSSAAKAVFGAINYNDYYTAGPNLGYIVSNRTTLANIITGFSSNANSISVKPNFVSATDLHLSTDNNCALDGAGVAIAGYTTDIDGDTRLSPPDIGADEFTGNFNLTITNPATACGSADITAAAVTAGSTTLTTLTYYQTDGITVMTPAAAAAITTSGTYFIKAVKGSCSSTKPVVVVVNPAGTWLGVDNNWFNSANWCGGVPTAATSVIIPGGLTNYPIIGSGNAIAGSVTITTVSGIGSIITVNGGASGGILSINGAVTTTGTGIIDATAGTINLAATAAVIKGTNFTGGSILNLTVGTTGGSTAVQPSISTSALTVTGMVNFLHSGNTLNTGGLLELASTSTGTASIGDITHNPYNATLISGNLISGQVTVDRWIGAPRKWDFLSSNATTTSVTVQNSWMEGQAPGTAATPALTGLGMWITDAAPATGFDAQSPAATMKWWNGTTYTGITDPTAYNIHLQPAYMTYVRGDRYATGANSLYSTTNLRIKGSVNINNFPSAGYITQIAGNNDIAVGNPYASAVDLSQIFTNTPGSTVITIKVWDPILTSGNGQGAFQTLRRDVGTYGTPDFYVVAPGGGSYPSPGNVVNALESGQAFFLQSSSGSNIDTRFTEVSKTPNVRQIFFTAGHPELISASLSISDANGLSLMDGFEVRFKDTYNSGADFDDARKSPNTNEAASVKTGGVLLAGELRGVVATSDNDTVHINMSGILVKDYQWKFNVVNMDEQGRAGFLVDQFLGTETALNLDGMNTYNFSSTGGASAAADRFMIVFKPAAVVPVTLTAISASRQADKTIAVKWKVENEINIGHYEVQRSANGISFTTIGNNQAPSNNAGGAAQYSLSDLSPLSADNYYRIKAISNNGQVQYSAVVKVGPLTKEPLITIYPNPVSDGVFNVKFVNKPAGTYQLQLTDKAGRTIYTQSVKISSDNEVRTINMNRRTPAGSYDLVIIAPDGKREVEAVVFE